MSWENDDSGGYNHAVSDSNDEQKYHSFSRGWESDEYKENV